MRRLLAIALAGCGRIGFDGGDAGGTGDGDAMGGTDATPCVAPIGHDEDGDTVDDACDLCASIADDQSDADGDGVGDICDPNPASAIDSLAVFDPFVETLPMWVLGTGATIGNDVLELDASGQTSLARIPMTPGRDTYTIVGAVTNVDATQHQLAIILGPLAGSGSYYCELYEDPLVPAFFLSMTYTFDGITFTSAAKEDLPGSFGTGPVMLRMEHALPNITCDAEWNGQFYRLITVIPSGSFNPEQAVIASTNLRATLTSFTRIATQ